ncbi:elongation factor P maturation arginine rhamnosyltransferase EarP [Polaromonas sp.]|uniref:elongation factor P maturation arginine rhamnosyltransferase EarP n=1 Tax=Polaromonas sp. TaxID=1869339 RepID=UPI0017EBDF32|nr:elongation factor P maturation arginine rhamnosyltransferase EarP [Polaromonas sp.]NML84280.1 elongation factor P maturation arginine rhamnosyltransferase EarP [Polaromonas sp.]
MNRRLQWDIFCKVIDNFGDIGVCWRLAADLATRGHRVRLWVDDASALRWMAPAGCKDVQVLPWEEPLDLRAARLALQPPDVLVAAFGCEITSEFIAACVDVQGRTGPKPVWINLEYLSAESYVERSHAMPSPVQNGPSAGWTKWFFYPGFTASTGGLLREPGLMQRQARFDCGAWLAAQGITRKGRPDDERLVSLFCYEPRLLGALLTGWAAHGLEGRPVRLLVAAGRAAKAVKTLFLGKKPVMSSFYGHELLSISYLPLLTQSAFDSLLWACDLNFVRGEDSVVRALWAGKPFVWQIYPQHDEAHLHKLDAFLDWLQAPPSLRVFHAVWNQSSEGRVAASQPLTELSAWQTCTLAARSRLLAQGDLSSQLLEFVAKKS